MTRRLDKIIFLISIVTALILVFAKPVGAETEITKDVRVSIDGNEHQLVRGLVVGYDNNKYVSMRDMQILLHGTGKQYLMGIAGGKLRIVTSDSDYSPNEEEDNEPKLRSADEYERPLGGWSEAEKEAFKNSPVVLNEINYNGQERRYYTIITDLGGYYDCFINVSDFCLLMNVDAQMTGEVIEIDSSQPMRPVNPIELEEDGYFQGVNSVLVGDATTGEIYYGYNETIAYPIASTTKLMTYLLVADAIQSGKISYGDMVTISKVAEDLSNTSDGLIVMKDGQTAPIEDLIKAALIISSNESDHAISEHIYGDEEDVVAAMNAKATELGMDTAIFYNCNGLPVYSESLIAAKKQNRMSSEDMFKLASHLLTNYPEIKDVTSIKKTKIESYDKELKNTNPLLYNMSEVTGLKTGTTNRSGACLVTSLLVNDGNIDHDIVVVMLGAEGSQDRGRVSELMARYGKAVVLGEAQSCYKTNAGSTSAKVTANSIVKMVVAGAMSRK